MSLLKLYQPTLKQSLSLGSNISKTLYDIIGDIHGEDKHLHALLKLLGYTFSKGFYQHPKRKAVFLGDLINKGPGTEAVLRTIKAMVEAGSAYAILGNHELNLIGYFHKHKQGEYVKPHTEKNHSQLAPTFAAFDQQQSLLKEYIAWMKTLPLFLAMEGFNLVHAFWHQKSIDFLKKYHPTCCLDDQLLNNMVPDSPACRAVEELLVGVKLEFPDSVIRAAFKAKWWKIGKTDCYEDLAIRPDFSLNNPKISFQNIDNEAYHYPETAPPLFFGHYNLPEKPRLLAHNYACLDFSPDDCTLLTAYRWDGEAQLKTDNLVYI